MNLYEIQNSMSIKFIETQPCSFIYLQSMAAFKLQWQRQVVLTDHAVHKAKHMYLLSGPLQEKSANARSNEDLIRTIMEERRF